MTSNLKLCSIRVSETYFGKVAGKLTTIGAWLGDESENKKLKNENGIMSISARIPKENIREFEKWLKETTQGESQFEINT